MRKTAALSPEVGGSEVLRLRTARLGRGGPWGEADGGGEVVKMTDALVSVVETPVVDATTASGVVASSAAISLPG